MPARRRRSLAVQKTWANRNQIEPAKPQRENAPPAKDWDAAAKPQQQEALPPKDWSKEAAPSTSTPEPRKDWSERAFEKGRGEIKPLPVRDRSRDDGPERD